MEGVEKGSWNGDVVGILKIEEHASNKVMLAYSGIALAGECCSSKGGSTFGVFLPKLHFPESVAIAHAG